MKKVLSVILVAVLLLTCQPVNARACGMLNISISNATVNFNASVEQTATIDFVVKGDEHELTYVCAEIVADNPLTVKYINGVDELMTAGNLINWMFLPSYDDEGEFHPDKDSATGEYIVSAESLTFSATVIIPAGTPVGKYEIRLSDAQIGDVNTTDYSIPDVVGTIEVVESGDCQYQYGDANHNGSMDARDGTVILRYRAGVYDGEFCKRCADVNGDGAIDAKDGTLILRRKADLIDKFPVEGQ